LERGSNNYYSIIQGRRQEEEKAVVHLDMLHIIFNQRSYLLIQHLVRLSDQDHVKNNLIENFFRILKNELLYSQGFHSMERLKQTLLSIRTAAITEESR